MQSQEKSTRRKHERTIYRFERRRRIFWGRARSRSTVTRRRFSTSCGGAACSGSGSGRCRQPGILRDSSKRLRLTRRRRRRHSSIRETLCRPCGAPTRSSGVPLKALVSQINYNLFDLEVGAQQSQFAYLQAKDLADAVDGLLRTHDVALWNGSDTSLSTPTTSQYFGVIGQIEAGGNTTTIAPRRASWTESRARSRRWWRVRRMKCGRRRSMPIRCCWT